jgi:phage gpG-like protein
MATTLNINVTGYKETNEALKNIRTELSDFSMPLIKSGGYYLDEIEQNFEMSGAKFNEPWEELSKYTIAEKTKLFSKGKAIEITKPLIRTGWLRNSFFTNLINKYTVKIETKAPYAELMHKGGISTKGGKVPARTLMKVDDERERKVNNIFADWLRNIVNKSFYNK